jgi:NTE family protein
LELLKVNAKEWEAEWKEENPASKLNAAGSLSTSRRVQFYIVEVSFDDLQDDEDKAYFEKLPTSFNLPPGAIARLRAVAGKLLKQSESYRALLRELASDPQQSKGSSR